MLGGAFCLAQPCKVETTLQPSHKRQNRATVMAKQPRETRTQEKARFFHLLMACYPDVVVAKLEKIANVLYRTSTTLGRLYEIDCSVQLSPRRQIIHDGHEARLEAMVKAYCDMIGLPFELNGDPRWCAIKVRLPNGKGNGWEEGVWYI
jgi:hypothetical protein